MDRPTAGSARTWPTPHTGTYNPGAAHTGSVVDPDPDFGQLDLDPDQGLEK
jgi:hypothetical protein